MKNLGLDQPSCCCVRFHTHRDCGVILAVIFLGTEMGGVVSHLSGPSLRKKLVLFIVDPQNDFHEGGQLKF
jgi:hypothetical protein